MKSFRKKQNRPKKSSLIAGADAIIQAMSEGLVLERIFIDQQRYGQLTALRKKATQYNVPVNAVPSARLESFNAGVHNGAVAVKSKIIYQALQDMISFTVDNGDVPLFLLLDGITDIRNIGGIARTAWCTGVQAIIIPDKGVGALNEDAILTSAGALEQIAVCRVNSLLKAIDELHVNGIKVYAAAMSGATMLGNADFTIPSAIVMGSEEKGIYPAILKACDENIAIPMKNNFESLNVSVATGMILYEAMQQRMHL